MRFLAALQKLCDAHGVKLMPGLDRGEDGSIRATLTAFKLGETGTTAAKQEIPAIVPAVQQRMA